eukprot:4462895-Karenia_brevis.AAC.1
MARIESLEEELSKRGHSAPAKPQRHSAYNLRNGRRLERKLADPTPEEVSIDTVWILAAGLICFFLQA